MKTTMHEELERNLLDNRRATPAISVTNDQSRKSNKLNETEAVVWTMIAVLLAFVLLFSYWFSEKLSP